MCYCLAAPSSKVDYVLFVGAREAVPNSSRVMHDDGARSIMPRMLFGLGTLTGSRENIDEMKLIGLLIGPMVAAVIICYSSRQHS